MGILRRRSARVNVQVSSKGKSKVTVSAKGAAQVNVSVSVKDADKSKLLRFGHGNSKLDAAVFTFSLPAGHFCPFAGACLAKADKDSGRIKDGAQTLFRCYAASMEARHANVRGSRWHNAQLLLACKTTAEMVSLILRSLSPFAGVVRIHDSGDFFNQDYFDAWLTVARQRPHTRFYFYTKSLRYWVARLEDVGNGHVPGKVPNFIATASWGGRDDALISEYGLRSARVIIAPTVESAQEQAAAFGLEIDHTDEHAMAHGPDFALLIHGMQPAGTVAAKAIASLRKSGEYGYGERADAARERSGRLPLAMVI